MPENIKKVLWLSQHRPDEGQIRELGRVLGAQVDLTVENLGFDHNPVAAVASRMRNFDELVTVAPTGVLDKLCQGGIRPLWPVMSEDRRRFVGFNRIIEIRKNRGDVDPVADAAGKKILWISRFPPHQGRQMAELRRLFGADVVVTHRDIPNAEDAKEVFEWGGYNAMVAVVPEAAFERLSALDLPLIRSESVEESNPARIEFYGTGGRGFRFNRYTWYRVEKITKRL